MRTCIFPWTRELKSSRASLRIPSPVHSRDSRWVYNGDKSIKARLSLEPRRLCHTRSSRMKRDSLLVNFFVSFSLLSSQTFFILFLSYPSFSSYYPMCSRESLIESSTARILHHYYDCQRERSKKEIKMFVQEYTIFRGHEKTTQGE